MTPAELRALLSAEEIEAIRARHEATFHGDGTNWQMHEDRATLLQEYDRQQYAIQSKNSQIEELEELLDAERAARMEAEAKLAEVRERAHNREVAVHDKAYAYGFRAGWNSGVTYEQCQEVQFERKASGNPELHLQLLAAMDDRIAAARAALKESGHE